LSQDTENKKSKMEAGCWLYKYIKMKGKNYKKGEKTTGPK
jgi:hypothetical protein